MDDNIRKQILNLSMSCASIIVTFWLFMMTCALTVSVYRDIFHYEYYANLDQLIQCITSSENDALKVK